MAVSFGNSFKGSGLRLIGIGIVLWALPGWGRVDFDRDILPIFRKHCFECHGQEEQKAGLGLATWYHSQQLPDSGEPAVVAGKAGESLLIAKIEGKAEGARMPLDQAPLSDSEIALIRKWIEEGASRPDDGWRPERHWAYEAPTLPDVPVSDGKGWARNEIDHFIARKLSGMGISNNPEAQPASLLRRLYLDLIGLPPTIGELDAFLEDDSPDKYERKVDELLSSRHFGERWARQWLDLARYADSEGYQRDELREIWPYRDWVIKALNDDMPFDRFTVEQIAGDLLPNPTLDQKIATGFHRNPTLNLEAGTDPNEDYYKQVVDRVNTTGTVWLGSTMACAQCHNHKYDPFSTKEYYELFAFFNNTPHESRQTGSKMGMSGMVYIGADIVVPRSESEQTERELKSKAYRRSLAELSAYLDPLCEAISSDAKELKKQSAAVRKQLKVEPRKRRVANYDIIIKGAFKNDARAKALLKQTDSLEKEFRSLSDYKTRVMQEMEEPRLTHIAKRGDFLNKGAQVEPGVPSILHAFPKDAPKNRLGLAQWLVSPDNPLVGRVTVNRIWAEIFGQGIVPTMEEFGRQGEAPTHPELLDWLAVVFTGADGWSRKALIRRIVTSSTYRQSSEVRSMAASVDPANQFLWRHPGHRLSAETIRDNALAISGLLSYKFGGPPAYPYQPDGVWRKGAGSGPTVYPVSKGEDGRRRGVYTVWRRSAHYASFANFDAPDRGACVIQRSRSNTPLQALTLLNDPEFFGLAKAFGERIDEDGGGSLDDKLTWAFRTVVSRSPSQEELAVLRNVHQQEINEGGSALDGYVNVANTLFNLHETISR